jgi:hypothetical protein
VDDHEAIRQLLYTYSFYLDRREYSKLGELLAASTFELDWDTEDEHTGLIRGREEIEGFYADHQAERRPSRHVITNAVIEIDPDGRTASAYSYLTSIGHPPEPPAVMLNGRYEDRFEKIDGIWRYTQKYCVMELPPPAG